MFYLYILKSQVNNNKYIGMTGKEVLLRLEEHNQKKVRSTKAYAPWILIYTENYQTKHEARTRELELKKNSWKRNELLAKLNIDK